MQEKTLSEQKRSSDTISLRIDSDIVDTLREVSAERSITLNTLANQILKRFVEWDIYELKVGMVPIPKQILVASLERLDPKTINDLATDVAKNVTKDIFLFLKGSFDIGTFIEMLEVMAKVSNITFKHTVQNSRHTFVLQHDLSYNCSLYIKYLLGALLQELETDHLDLEFETTPSTVVLRLTWSA